VRKNQDLLHLARSAAEAAAGFIRGAKRPSGPDEWGRKSTHDFVTSIDREAEQKIRGVLLGGEPGSSIMGEEFSPEGSVGSGLVWVVDPLDGTTNYLHGYPQYAVSVGALVDGELAVGVVADVDRNVYYHAERGAGAWRGSERLTVSRITEPGVSMIGTGFPFRHPDLMPRYMRQFAGIMRAVSGIRRAGAAALDLVDVALGRFEGFWELNLAPWDVAAGTLIVREAGGIVTDGEGSTNMIKHGSVVAGNSAIHAWLQAIVAEP